jgi:23S rRNA (uracil1939-C5)-methyltransferase
MTSEARQAGAGEGPAGEVVTIHAIAHGGEGVGRSEGGDGRIWLVEGALPGEQVLAARTEEHKRMLRGRIIKVVAASPERVAPPDAETCGGCGFQHVRPQAQAELKRQIAEGQLRRLGIAVTQVVPSPQAVGYRRRARVHYERAGEGLRIGFYRRKTREIFEGHACPVLHPTLQHAIERVRLLAPVLRERGEVALIGDGTAVVVGVPGLAPLPDDPGEERLRAALQAALDGVVVGVVARGGRRDLVVGRGRLALDAEGPEDMPVRTGPFEFAQAQSQQNRALVRKVVELAAPRGLRVLELFAGAGNFTRALAREAAEVVAIEADRDSAAGLLRLAKQAGAKGQATIEARRGDATRALQKLAAEGRGFDCVVLNPPRAGLGLAGARALAQVARGRTVLVSCDPATLARDLEPLLAAGHRPVAAVAFDLMPMTPEVEVVVALDAQHGLKDRR